MGFSFDNIYEYYRSFIRNLSYKLNTFSMKMSTMKWLVAGFATAGILLLVSWQHLPSKAQQNSVNRADTIPGQRDFDKELNELVNARKQMAIASQQDFSAVQQQLQESLAALDANKIQLQVEKALSQANIELSLRAAEEAVKRIEIDKIIKEVETESKLKAKEKEKIREELSKAKVQLDQELKNKNWKEELKDVDFKQLEKEMQQARIELDKAKVEMGENESNIRKELNQASTELVEAESELKGYQEMIYKMEGAKLLNTKKDYLIEWNAPQLKINGKVQSQAISDTYKQYFKAEKTLIKKENGKMNVRKGDED